MRIVYVGATYPRLELFCPNFTAVKAGLKRLGVPHLFLTCRPEFTDFDAIKEFKPDLIIYGLLDMIKKPAWRQRIKAENPQAKIVFWYGDLRDSSTGQIDADASDLDAMFVSNDAQEKFYKSLWKVKSCKFLPLGCEPISEPMVDKKFGFDFVFIGGKISAGSFIPRMREITRFEESGLTVINSNDSDLRAKIFEKMPVIYSSSKISLDMSHFTHIQSYTSNRFWNIPAMYGFPLTKRFPNCENLFKNRAYFDTFTEAIELRDYYLTHEKERKALVEAAHKESFNHTGDKRFLEMFKMLDMTL